MKLSHIIATTLVTMALSLPAQEPFDYCNLGKKASELNRYIAGEEIKERVLEFETYPRPENAGENLFSEENIINENKTGDYTIIIIPIGYSQQEIRDKMQYLMPNLQRAFSEVNVDFGYLDFSVPIDIGVVGHYPFLLDNEQGHEIKKYLKTIKKGDTCAFLFNSQIFAAGQSYYTVSAGEGNDQAWSMVHEVGHELGLWDGYRRFYKNRNESEWFLHFSHLDDYIKKAQEKIKAPIEPMKNGICDGEVIFQFYPDQEDIMDCAGDDEDLQRKLEENTVFNPLQKEIMNNYIKILLD